MILYLSVGKKLFMDCRYCQSHIAVIPITPFVLTKRNLYQVNDIAEHETQVLLAFSLLRFRVKTLDDARLNFPYV